MSDDRATEIIKSGDIGAIVRMGLGSALAAEEGRYCECATPSLYGDGLMCGHCLLRNKDQERAKVDRIAGAHDFVAGDSLGGRLCEVCTMGREAPRHNGVSAVGRCSWGEERRPGAAPAHLESPEGAQP